MKKYVVLALLLLSVFAGAQSRVNMSWQAILNASLVSGMPSSPYTGQTWVITDGTGSSPCSSAGGGSTKAFCRWNGSSWDTLGGGGGVTSFNSRTGAISPASGDYSFSQISGSLAHSQLPALQGADIPANAANTSGNAGTATQLSALPTTCSTGQAPLGILANGNATGCWTPTGGVTSFNSRTGAIVPATGDYSFSQISGTLAHNQLPALQSSDIPSNAANTSGSAGSVAASGVTAGTLPSGVYLPWSQVTGQPTIPITRTYSWPFSGTTEGGAAGLNINWDTTYGPSLVASVTGDLDAKMGIPNTVTSTNPVLWVKIPLVPKSPSGIYNFIYIIRTSDPITSHSFVFTPSYTCVTDGKVPNISDVNFPGWTALSNVTVNPQGTANAEITTTVSSVSMTCAAGGRLYVKFNPVSNTILLLNFNLINIDTQAAF